MQALLERLGKFESAESHREVSNEVRGQLFSKKRASPHLQAMAGPMENLSVRKVKGQLQPMGQCASNRNKKLLGNEIKQPKNNRLRKVLKNII